MRANIKFIAAKTDHIFHMTDDTGMLQHSIYGVPNLLKGYTSDDNARALIMAVGIYELYRVNKIERLIYKYISFLHYAQNADGTFRNLMDYNRRFTEEKGSDDCFGRCIWALCCVYVNTITPQNVKRAIWEMIEKALPNCLKIKSPRANAYIIIGLSYLNTVRTNGYITKLADLLTDHYAHYHEDDWHWFEESITYSNAVLPRAMLKAFSVTGVDWYKHIGFESLKFLENKTFQKGYFKPIGCTGWLYKGHEPAEFDEQPVEACETMLAYLDAYAVSGYKVFLNRAKTCFSWYHGNNSKNLCLLDAETGGCYDGITPDGLNLNQGAESVVSFWIAYMEYKKLDNTEKQILSVNTI